MTTILQLPRSVSLLPNKHNSLLPFVSLNNEYVAHTLPLLSDLILQTKWTHKLHIAEVINNDKLTELGAPDPAIDKKFVVSIHGSGPLHYLLVFVRGWGGVCRAVWTLNSNSRTYYQTRTTALPNSCIRYLVHNYSSFEILYHLQSLNNLRIKIVYCMSETVILCNRQETTHLWTRFPTQFIGCHACSGDISSLLTNTDGARHLMGRLFLADQVKLWRPDQSQCLSYRRVFMRSHFDVPDVCVWSICASSSHKLWVLRPACSSVSRFKFRYRSAALSRNTNSLCSVIVELLRHWGISEISELFNKKITLRFWLALPILMCPVKNIVFA